MTVYDSLKDKETSVNDYYSMGEPFQDAFVKRFVK